MAEIPLIQLINIVIFLGAIVVVGVIGRSLRVSLITGYLVSGVVLGNFLNRFYSYQLINNFAYIGIILLLFTVGLEINFRQIIDLKKYIIIGGSLQILLSILVIGIISRAFGMPWLPAILIGIAFSSSSTSIVAKMIQDRGEEGSFEGELALGILMFQDLAFIPFLIIFTVLSSKQIVSLELLPAMVIGLIKAGLLIMLLYYTGQRLVPLVFNRLAKTSRELLNLFIVFFIFFITFISSLFQIPILIGVFVAGILVGQTYQHLHVFSQIRPVRDILAIIFFVYIGLNLKLALILPIFFHLVIFAAVVLLAKFLIVLSIFLLLRFHTKAAYSLGLYLFQIDEDAFILLSLAYTNKLITDQQFALLLAVIIIGFLISPFLIKQRNKLYRSVRQGLKKYLPALELYISQKIDSDRSPLDVLNIKDHIVICGYGRVGSYIGRALLLSDISFIAVDYNYAVVEKAKKEGVNIIYGDPSDINILDYVQVDEAKVLISVVPDITVQEAIIINARRLNPKIIIFNRIQREGQQQRLRDLGAEMVIHPEFEASLSIIRRILYWKGLDKEEIARKIKRLKIEHGML